MTNSNGRKVLLVCWEGADWNVITPLLDRGELPNLAAFTEQGVMGDMFSTRPLMKPTVFNTVATGKYGDKHGVFGTHEVCDFGKGLRPVTSDSRRAKAFWEILSQNDIPCHVVNFPGTGPAEAINGVFVDPSFFSRIPPNHWDPFELPPDCVWPADQVKALQTYLVSLQDIDRQTMALFIPKFDEVNQEDRRLRTLSSALAHTLSAHAVTTWLMENTEWRVMSVNYQAIDLLAREFLRFYPPKLDWVFNVSDFGNRCA